LPPGAGERLGNADEVTAFLREIGGIRRRSVQEIRTMTSVLAVALAAAAITGSWAVLRGAAVPEPRRVRIRNDKRTDCGRT
jgi:hypothetical protein